MLIRKFYQCSVNVKFYSSKTFCLLCIISLMWFDRAKSPMKKIKVAYNNSLRKLLTLPSYNNKNFAVLNIPLIR